MSRRRVLLAVVIALVSLAVTAAPSFAAVQAFTAHLAGENEVPAVDTKAKGQAVLRLSADGTELHYRLVVSSMENVTAAHIHLGPAGANGPVVAFLTRAHPGTSHGVLDHGTVTAADLVGPLAGMQLSDLVEAMEAGDAYVNVHTVVYPAGEIRGQVR